VNCDVTYEELAALAAQNLPPAREAEVLVHLGDCERCRRRLDRLRQADGLLGALRPPRAPAEAVLAARKALAEVLHRPRAQEIMTLEEVSDFLRLAPGQLAEVVEELPAFELAGQVRVRRARLVEWIERREQDYSRHRAGSWAARETSDVLNQGAY